MTVTVVLLGLVAWCALSVVVALLIGGAARVRDRQVPGRVHRVHEPAEVVAVASTHPATRYGDRAAPQGDRAAPKSDRTAPNGDRAAPQPQGDRAALKSDRAAPKSASRVRVNAGRS